MDEEVNIQDEEQLMPSAQEALLMKRALRRRHIPAPDVDQEWERFVASHQETPSRSFRKAHIVGFLLGIAASMAVLLALYPLLKSSLSIQEQVDGVQIFSANNEPTEVMLDQGSGQPATVQDKSLSFNSSTPQKVQNSKFKALSPKFLTLTTPRGKDYRLTLPDGTRVWMNAESRLEFPETFVGKTREVKLHGEAYFEVTKDEQHPFIVKTDQFSTRVLGTAFNIRSYSDRDANVVLVEGSVALERREEKGGKREYAITLIPGQQALFNAQSPQFKVMDVDTYPFTQWKDGFFYFDDTPLIQIMQELGRWYNVNIVFEEAKAMDTRLHFVAERSLPLQEIIRNMNDLDVVKIDFQHHVITIK